MDTMTLIDLKGALAGHAVEAFHPGVVPRSTPPSIGEQQARMALRALEPLTAPARLRQASDLAHVVSPCPHCGETMRLEDDRRLGISLLLSGECPRCGCLRASFIEGVDLRRPLLEIPRVASFD
jgi:hypothetical protein